MAFVPTASTAAPTTSLFVPVEYELNTFTASIAGTDASATTFVFDCASASSCGPVTVIQGPSTARFIEADQPLTTVWDCPDYAATAATCTLTSMSGGSSYSGSMTTTYTSAVSAAAFPTYEAILTGGAGPETARRSLFSPLASIGGPELSFAPGPVILSTLPGVATETSTQSATPSSSQASQTSAMASSSPVAESPSSSGRITAMPSSVTGAAVPTAASGSPGSASSTGAAAANSGVASQLTSFLFWIPLWFL